MEDIKIQWHPGFVDFHPNFNLKNRETQKVKYLTDWPVLLTIKFYIKLKNQSINK